MVKGRVNALLILPGREVGLASGREGTALRASGCVMLCCVSAGPS
jgi:hypothetical protein